MVPLCDSTAQEAAACSLNTELSLCCAWQTLNILAACLIHVPLGCCTDREQEPSLPGLSALLPLSERSSPASSTAERVAPWGCQAVEP